VQALATTRRGRPPKVTAEAWERAALDALADGGLAAVAIEPIAARLGTSKGSFYWYFPNRDALIRAALSRWEQDHTEQVVRLLEQIPDPVRRLRELVRGALLGTRGAAVALLLLADADDPLVGEVVHRVTARRLEVLTGCFTALGQDPERAHHHALVGYCAYLGAAALRRGTPDLAPGLDERYLETVLAAFGVPPA
jgi:AcrR family transcriptional regulator